MSTKTKIEWTDVTDNIIVVDGGGWWCRKISPGCVICYAEKLNFSPYFGGNKMPYTGEPPKLFLRRDLMDGWKRQKKAKKHFVASMTDVFGEWVPAEWQFEMLDAMAAAPLQTFQVLTKRADVMALHVVAWLKARGLAKVPANIWLGFTAENQEWFDKRWAQVQPLLPFKSILFVSVEPMLGPIDFSKSYAPNGAFVLPHGIDWIICGGESGSKARPMHPEWVRLLRDQCTAAGIAFLFKQWGEWRPNLYGGDGSDSFHFSDPFQWMNKVGKKKAGRLLDGREWNGFPKSDRLQPSTHPRPEPVNN